jgi:hypothetical protein
LRRATRQRALIPSFLPVNVLVNLIVVNQMDPYDSDSSDRNEQDKYMVEWIWALQIGMAMGSVCSMSVIKSCHKIRRFHHRMVVRGIYDYANSHEIKT